MTSERKEKIVELIAKLKALSVNNPNEEEAALAAARMQELIGKYKISEAELNVDEEPDETGSHLFYKEKGNRFTRWRLNLAYELARANNCKGVRTQGDKFYSSIRGKKIIVPAKMQIIGTEGNVATCKYVFMYLCSEIERLSKRALLKYNMENPYEKGGKSFAISFKVGAVDVIIRRIRQQRIKTREEAGTAIVLFDKEAKAADDWMRQHMQTTRSSCSMSATDHDGYSAGQAAGKGLSIGPSNNNGKAVSSGPKALPR